MHVRVKSRPSKTSQVSDLRKGRGKSQGRKKTYGARGLGINDGPEEVSPALRTSGRWGQEVCVSLPPLGPVWAPPCSKSLSGVRGAPRPSHTPGIKAQFPRRANVAKGGRKGLLKFPRLPSFLTTFFRSKAQRQVPICKAASGNMGPAAPAQWKGKQEVKKALQVPTVRMFLSQIP